MISNVKSKFLFSALNKPIINIIKCKMAYSRFEYVRENENFTEKYLLPECYIVVRVDGKSFHNFSDVHQYVKPNDKRALDLMNSSAMHVMKELFPNIILSYGQSDEFSFIFSKESNIFFRRSSKLTSIVASLFTSAFVFNWNKYFDEKNNIAKVELKYPPSFDARCVIYQSDNELIDYLKWRQVDCYINNIYNTTFYALTGIYNKWLIDDQNLNYYYQKLDLDKGLSPKDAHECIKSTSTKQRLDGILKDKFNIIYENELEQFKRGSLILIDKEKYDFNKIKKEFKKKNPNFNKIINLEIINLELIKSDFLETTIKRIKDEMDMIGKIKKEMNYKING